MRLLFDIGNTRIKWALELSGDLQSCGVVDHKKFDMTELEACLFDHRPEIESVWACSVAGKSIEQKLASWVSKRLGQSIHWAVVEQVRSGVRNSYTDLNKLGVDRWMVVLGAAQYRFQHGLLGRPVIIIDAGTAVTVELLNVEGHYEGGVILPGLRLMHDSLVGQTEGIVSTLVDASNIIGRDTQACVNSGVHFGLIGAIERVVREIMCLPSVIDSEVLILLTGGDASFIERNSNLNYKVEPQLVLSGLICVANGSEEE